MTNRKATLSLDGDLTVDLPILEGTRGQDVIDISSLGGMVISLMTPASQPLQPVNPTLHISTVVKGFYCTAVILLSNLRKNQIT